MLRSVRNPILGCLASALLLGPVAVLSYKVSPTLELDRSIQNHFTAHDAGAAHAISTWFAHLVDPLPFIVLLAGIVLVGVAIGRTRETAAAVAVVAGATLSTQVLKVLMPWAWAFPSGHTTAAASLAVALVLIAPPRLRPPAAALGAALVAFTGTSVIVLGWHFPGDVLGGLLVVASWTFAAIAALRLLRPRGPSTPRGEVRSSSGRFAISLP
ncbi:MAG TPA: phosphatase PAP2 family protein [Solirubrobacterales bacterium]|jgi:membrane-associated phospholipid phosphatase